MSINLEKETEFILDNVTYRVKIRYKPFKKNISYRYKDGEFSISSPLLCSNKEIFRGLDKFAPLLIKRSKRPLPRLDNKIYILGKLYDISNNQILLSDGAIIDFKDEIGLEKELKKYFLKVVSQLVRKKEAEMGISLNNIRVKKMKSRYGSNSKRTRTVCFNLELIHYDIEVIEAIVVHELAHCLVFDHSKKFYDVVYRYCPNYKTLHKRLRKGEFAHD